MKAWKIWGFNGILTQEFCDTVIFQGPICPGTAVETISHSIAEFMGSKPVSQTCFRFATA